MLVTVRRFAAKRTSFENHSPFPGQRERKALSLGAARARAWRQGLRCSLGVGHAIRVVGVSRAGVLPPQQGAVGKKGEAGECTSGSRQARQP